MGKDPGWYGSIACVISYCREISISSEERRKALVDLALQKRDGGCELEQAGRMKTETWLMKSVFQTGMSAK